MDLFGRIFNTVSAVSNLFTNPYRVREVPLSEYVGWTCLREDGRVILYKNQTARSWDCILVTPQRPQNSYRLFQLDTEAEALQRFTEYAVKLRPFYESARQGLRLETVQQLTDCLRSNPNWSLAHVAVELGLRESFRHNGILRSVNSTQCDGGCTPLHLACKKGDIECLQELVEECQARQDIADLKGETVYHHAAQQNNPRVIEILCSVPSVGINHVSLSGESPLHVACRFGKAESVLALLRCHAQPDLAGPHGFPIHTAIKYSQKGCAEAILDVSGSQARAEDQRYGATPLHWAKTAEMALLLIERGCNVNSLSKTAETPLHIMVKKDRFECAMVLLTHGADSNAKGEHGNTPLHLAMKKDHLELIKALMVFGADVELPNDFGETPGLMAARSSKGSNRKVLLSMLCNVGAERCFPPNTQLSPSNSPARVPPMDRASGIGFQDLVYVSTALSSMLVSNDNVDFAGDGFRKRDRLLCLDGGGIRGLVLIQLLIAIEKATGRPIRELFDWVSGTSTGGILALAIVHGKSMNYLRCLYFRMKNEVFRGSRPYESGPLEDFLKREFGEQTKMSDVRTPKVMVTGTLSDRHPAELHLFRNYDPPETGRDPPFKRAASFRPITNADEQLVWRAARSSGAAPTYFRPMGRFLDGGLLSNNPTLDAMAEIHDYNTCIKHQGKVEQVKKLGVVVSLGTGKPPQVNVSSVDVFRPSNPWEVMKTMVGARELGKMVVDCKILGQFNPALENLVYLGNNYLRALSALSEVAGTYFNAIKKIGEQALQNVTCHGLGQLLIQMADSCRTASAGLDLVFQTLHGEILQHMDKNTKLDMQFIHDSQNRYEMEYRQRAATLDKCMSEAWRMERQRDRNLRDMKSNVNLLHSDLLSFVRESQRAAELEEKRRYRFLAERHLLLCSTFLQYHNRAQGLLQNRLPSWKEQVEASRAQTGPAPQPQSYGASRPASNTMSMGQRDVISMPSRRASPADTDMRGPAYPDTGKRGLQRTPSNGTLSNTQSRTRSSSFGEVAVAAVAAATAAPGTRRVQAIVDHNPGGNPTMLPFSKGVLITVLVPEAKNGWLYGKVEGQSMTGWFPEAYVKSLDQDSRSFALRSAHSTGDLLEAQDNLPKPDYRPMSREQGPPNLNSQRGSEANPAPPPPTFGNSAGKKVPGGRGDLFPRGINPFATVKLRPTVTNDRSAPLIR